MQAYGNEEEEAAMVLGASGCQMFFRVPLPNVKWGLLYGIIICNARAMGEYGAVSVVSGKIRGLTATMPVYVELLYNSYEFAGAFAMGLGQLGQHAVEAVLCHGTLGHFGQAISNAFPGRAARSRSRPRRQMTTPTTSPKTPTSRRRRC